MAAFPKNNLKFVHEIHCVSYACKDETPKHEIRGRTLPIVYKIILYPKASDKLHIVLAHEIGHILFERMLSTNLKSVFASEIIATFPQILFRVVEGRQKFINEEFANCYDNAQKSGRFLAHQKLLCNFLVFHEQ